MDAFLARISQRLFQGAFVAFALFIPFSIAGVNFAVGFGALAWVLSTLARRGASVGEGAPLLRRDPLVIASLLLAVSALPAVLRSEDGARALNDWRSYWEMSIYFLVAGNLAAARMRERAFWVLFASAAISCGVAFVQRAGGVELGWFRIGAAHRVSSTLFTMTFAGILSQLIAMNAAVAFSRESSPRLRALLAAGVAVQFVALLLTMTRGAWVAAVAGLAAVCALTRSRLAAASAALLVAGMIVFSLAYARDQGRTLSIGALMGSSPDRNVHTRLVLWKTAWTLFRAHPILGVGMGDFTIEADRYLEATGGGAGVRTTSDSHNVPLQVLATRGLVGFIPFVFYWVTLLRVLAATRRRHPRGSLAHQYAVGALGATVALLVGSLTENNIDDSEVFMAFMFLVGLARSVEYLPRANGANAPSPSPGPPPQT